MKKFILTFLAVIFAAAAFSEAEPVMTYQGRLKESSLPVTGNRDFSFNFCSLETGGVCIPSPANPQSFAVANGLFKSTFTVPAVDLSAGSWYLQVSVGASQLSPREKLTFVPYSVYAASAGYAASAVQKTGDTMTGPLTLLSSITVVDAAGVGLSRVYFTSNVELSSAAAANFGGIYSSSHVFVNGNVYAAKLYGNGAGLTGITASAGAGGDGSALTNLTAANIAPGSLPDTVIVSSVAVDSVYTNAIRDIAVTDAKIFGMSSSKLVGALPGLDGSALTGLTKAQVGLGNVTNDVQLRAANLDVSGTLGTSDIKIPSQYAVKTYADTKIASAEKGAASGVAPLDGST
ncbi:MAG TPA: hypothetical protein DCL44_02300, partial [Elusimicrobia bacterium]|nr:hypothetical protein [Elusimicrobiota bacterium]